MMNCEAMGDEGKVKHYRVYHKPGLKFTIGKTEVDSVQQIVTLYGEELGKTHLVQETVGLCSY